MFRHHPDGLIFLGAVQLPLKPFQAQEPNYALPAGAIGREYIPNERHILFDGYSQWAGDLPWEEGDRYLSKVADYQASVEASNQAPLTLEQLKVQKLAALDDLCTAAISGGFDSSSLGASHRYSSKLEDQFNLKATRDLALEFGTPIEYVCTDSEGNKAARMHTAEQINQVFFDGLAIKRGLIFRFHSLRLQVEASTTVENLSTIRWDESST